MKEPSDTTGRPSDSDAAFTLLDLVSMEELQRVQDSFANATGVASIIVDTEGNSLTLPSNFSPVCKLVLSTPEGQRRCNLSDRQRRMNCSTRQRPHYHQCTSCGFADAGAPIVIDGHHIADWLIGQSDIYDVGADRLRAFAREIGIDEIAMMAAYEQVVPMPRERFERLLDLLWHVAHGLSELGYRNLRYRRDLAERQHIEAQLLSRERENRALLDAMPDLMFRISRKGVFEGYNGSADDMYIQPEKFTGKSVIEILPPELAAQTMAHLELAFATGAVQVYEYTLPFPEGDRHFESRMIAGLPESAVAIVRDITERKRAEEQEARLRDRLDKAERMESLGILAGGVAHDLNNLLGPLVGYPELILGKLPGDSPVRRYIESMRKAAVDATEVIQDLLTLARRGRYDMSPVDLNEVVQSCLQSGPLRTLASRKPQIALRVNLCDKIAAINGSFPHLQKLVINLVANAFEAMDTGGEITITVEHQSLDRLRSGYRKLEPGEYVIFSVRDTGRGIDPEDIEKIFEPYYSKKKIGAGGTGLGLPVVYGVIKDHSGYYDVFSEIGRGSEFVVYLKAIPAPAASRQISEDTAGRGESVLVVDDDPAQRELAAELLGSFGYCVTTAPNGRAAIRILTNTAVDLLVLDMIMEEGFDGLDTYREILKVHPGQRAVIVSGFSSTDRVQEMLRLGASAYIKKPYTRQALGRAVRTALDEGRGVATGACAEQSYTLA